MVVCDKCDWSINYLCNNLLLCSLLLTVFWCLTKNYYVSRKAKIGKIFFSH